MHQTTFTTGEPATSGSDIVQSWTPACWLLAALVMTLAETASSFLMAALPHGSQVTVLVEGCVVAALILKTWRRRPPALTYWISCASLSIAAFVLAKQAQDMAQPGFRAISPTMILLIAGLILSWRIAARRTDAPQMDEEGLRCIVLAVCGTLAWSATRWLIDYNAYSPLDLSSIFGVANVVTLIVYTGTKVSPRKLFWVALFSSCALGVLSGIGLDYLVEVNGRFAILWPALTAMALFVATLVAKNVLHAIHLRTLGIKL